MTDAYNDQPIIANGTEGWDGFWGTDADETFNGNGGDDWIEGGGGSDILNGGAGDDALDGGAGNDVITGGAGHDVLSGGAGADVFVFAPGSGYDLISDFNAAEGDTIDLSACDPSDISYTIDGADTIISLGQDAEVRVANVHLSGTDTAPVTIYGTDGWDGFWGTDTDENYNGEGGDDWIEGAGGDDILNGGAGDDGVFGDDGDDMITGGAGHDILAGGAGADLFVFEQGSGFDHIQDFSVYEGDMLDISDYAGLNIALRQDGDDAVLTLGCDAEVRLEGVNAYDLTPETFKNGVYPEMPVNQGPDANDDTAMTDAGKAVEINVTANDTDADGDQITVKSATDGENGTVSVGPNGTVTYTPNDGFSGDDWFTYTIEDGNGGHDTATVDVTVKEPEPVYADLAIDKTIQNVSGVNWGYASRGEDTDYGFGGAVMKYTITVTNTSDVTASHIVVKDETPENLDVWKEGDSLTHSETGIAWNNNIWGHNFRGSPESTDTSNGSVTVTEAEFIGAQSRPLQPGQEYGLDGGEIVWNIGGELEAGESATLTYHGMREALGGYNFQTGTKFETKAEIVSAKQHLTNTGDDYDAVINQWISPIAFDLNGDGEIAVTGRSTAKERINDEVNATVNFDLDADGVLEHTEWLNGDGDALLVDNRDGNAANDMDGARLLGDQGGLFEDGFVKLALLDADNSGAIEGAELDGLELWLDNGDAIVQDGELQALELHAIASISVERQDIQNEYGETLMRSEATLNDGSVMVTEDIWFGLA
jgi:uncharacterized repeat protein (TIGR01451 family)